MLDLLPELGKCLDRKAGVLSGGEQQMLAVGRALVSRPRLLLVDEMSLGLAPVIVERLLPVLRRVAEGFGAGGAVRRAARHARARGRRARLRAEPRPARARGRDRRTCASRRDLLHACYLGDLEAAAQLSADLDPPEPATSTSRQSRSQ